MTSVVDGAKKLLTLLRKLLRMRDSTPLTLLLLFCDTVSLPTAAGVAVAPTRPPVAPVSPAMIVTRCAPLGVATVAAGVWVRAAALLGTAGAADC